LFFDKDIDCTEAGVGIAGEVRFEREAPGKVAIVLLVDGQQVARSESAASIAAEVAFLDIATLSFGDAFTVNVPTDAAALVTAAKAAGSTPDIFTAYRLISECAW
jgi:hypothetical protein